MHVATDFERRQIFQSTKTTPYDIAGIVGPIVLLVVPPPPPTVAAVRAAVRETGPRGQTGACGSEGAEPEGPRCSGGRVLEEFVAVGPYEASF
ncbi:hypothetical protein TRAPUB_3910 [Trametes pubescens]|uniref:Uncharacterized protein n=1 Tax=Trametes pubescens TaxID=154538 RepID=A0A1M2W7G7_TRAPU|nr:hypothetical protein TRAPUB_3910 [Trametes pubescens]